MSSTVPQSNVGGLFDPPKGKEAAREVFATKWQEFQKMVEDLLFENKTMYGLVQSKTQELEVLSKAFSNADMLTEALGRVAPERLVPGHRLPPPSEEIKNDYDRWFAKWKAGLTRG